MQSPQEIASYYPTIVGSPQHIAALEQRIKALEEALRAFMIRHTDDGK